MKTVKETPVRSEFVSDTINHRPDHNFVKHWVFSSGSITAGATPEETKAKFTKASMDAFNEANLADAVAEVAAQNGMSANDVAYAFPMILRMLKSKSDWTK